MAKNIFVAEVTFSNLAITKICVAIRLAEDGTRMEGI